MLAYIALIYRLCSTYSWYMRYGVVEKLWCDRCCYRYATRIHGPCFDNLARLFHTAASGIYMPCIYILSDLLNTLNSILKLICIYAAYAKAKRG
jgi:hypothetical protein